MKAFVVAICLAAAATAAHAKRKPPLWKIIESENGSKIKVDVNSFDRMSNGTAWAMVYSVDGSTFRPENLRRIWFDCQGHYRDETGSIGPTLLAPPRSMIGQVSTMACDSRRSN